MTNHLTTKLLMAPRTMPEAQPYWDAAAEGKLLVKRCRSCNDIHFYPRDICPHCLSDDTEWLQACGIGSVYSFSTMKRPGAEGGEYTLAFVTLDEGVTMMTQLVDFDPTTLAIGTKVEVRFAATKARDGTDGAKVPVFTPQVPLPTP